MAGIAGVLGNDTGTLDLMLERIEYRGPDKTWKCRDGYVSMGCNELNMVADCKDGSHYVSKNSSSVVLDGRVYNTGKGNLTDAEAVLDLYDRFGLQFAGMIDGDFACAVSDNGRLVLARDHAGIKPLYYGHDTKGNLCFASEAKALVGVSYNVREFPPGYIYSRELGFRKYPSDAVETPEFESYEQARKVTRQLLEEAVEKRMKDNAVKGILLSGGLDSSLIAYMAYQINPDVECFTVSMEEGQDLPLARDVTKYLGIKHHILMFGEKEINEILPLAIHHQEMYEESCVHGAIANFLAGRFVTEHKIKCVLTGEGADEFFAGYDGQYKQGRNPEEVASIVDNLINVAHNTALQRLDRLNAANSYESRTPFLDAKVMDFSLKIPLECKIYGEDQIGKWILRQAFEGCLPDHIIYQTKRFFSQGSGVSYIMRRQAEKAISEAELAEFNIREGNPLLSSVEELYYYKIFKETLPHLTFDRLVGRWDPMRPSFFPEWGNPIF
ncbi:MAG: asparagine synthase-related protein [Thermodesulfobacteriota bacterium]|nr:asparagine synthase-related protein [Thermodesulfobacteriota bacterium]